MSDSDSELDSLLAESEYTLDEDENHDHRSSCSTNIDDYVICRKPTRFIQYESSQIFYHKSHAPSRLTRLLRNFLFLLCFATVLTIFTYLSTQLGNSSRFTILPGWNRNTTRYIPVYILPDVNTALIEPTNVCDGDDKLLLLIVVCSSPDNFDRR